MKLNWGMKAIRAAFQALGPLLPSLMGRVAFWFWFRPRPARKLQLADSPLAEADAGSFRFRGKRCARYRWGERRHPCVVLIHGWNGRAAQMAHFAPPLLAAGYRVVAFDAPAHGDSEGARTDVFEISEAFAHLEHEEGPFEAAITHSMGALVCATAVASRQVRVRRAVLLAPALNREAILKGFSRMLNLPDPVMSDLARRVDAFAGQRFWEDAVMDIPTMVVHDETDEYLPYAAAARLEAIWPATSLFTTRGLGHFGLLADAAVTTAVVAFISAQHSEEPRLA